MMLLLLVALVILGSGLSEAASYSYQPECPAESPNKVVFRYKKTSGPMEMTATPDVGNPNDALLGSGNKYSSTDNFSFQVQVKAAWVGITHIFKSVNICFKVRHILNVTAGYSVDPEPGAFIDVVEINDDDSAVWTKVCFAQQPMVNFVTLSFEVCGDCIAEVKALKAVSCHKAVTGKPSPA